MNGNGARNSASNGAVAATVTLPHDPVAELMEQVANGRVRPRDAAAQVRVRLISQSQLGLSLSMTGLQVRLAADERQHDSNGTAWHTQKPASPLGYGAYMQHASSAYAPW